MVQTFQHRVCSAANEVEALQASRREVRRTENPDVTKVTSDWTMKDLLEENHVPAHQKEVEQSFVPIDAAEARRRILKGSPKTGQDPRTP